MKTMNTVVYLCLSASWRSGAYLRLMKKRHAFFAVLRELWKTLLTEGGSMVYATVSWKDSLSCRCLWTSESGMGLVGGRCSSTASTKGCTAVM